MFHWSQISQSNDTATTLNSTKNMFMRYNWNEQRSLLMNKSVYIALQIYYITSWLWKKEDNLLPEYLLKG